MRPDAKRSNASITAANELRVNSAASAASALKLPPGCHASLAWAWRFLNDLFESKLPGRLTFACPRHRGHGTRALNVTSCLRL